MVRAVMMTYMPCGIPTIITVEIRIEPRVVPHASIATPSPIATIMRVMVGIVAVATPAIVVSHHIITIIPVARCGEHVGIHTIVIDIPLPAGPQRTAIHYIPIEGTAHGDGIARITESHDAHGILVVGLTAVEPIHPALTFADVGEAQRIGIHPQGVALGGDEHESFVAGSQLRHGIAALGQIGTTAIVGVLIHIETISREGSH